jgi:hypothetical protein
MDYVLCDVSPGLRVSERTVAVSNIHGKREYLRVEADYLHNLNGQTYLPIDVVYVDPARQAVLVELPFEADSGAPRVWVSQAHVLSLNGGPSLVPLVPPPGAVYNAG